MFAFIPQFLKQIARCILAPPHCTACKIMLSHDFPLCDPCRLAIRRIIPTEVRLTPTKTIAVFTLGAYEEPLAQLVRAKQHRSIAAAQQIGVLLAAYIRDWGIPLDYVVPVPLHWRRYAWRGYNQTQVMASEVAHAKQLPLRQLLKRVRHTAYQMTCSAQGRHTNVQDAFELRVHERTIYEGKHILIVDDLLTTGATLAAVGRALLPLKPASISALVACKVI